MTHEMKKISAATRQHSFAQGLCVQACNCLEDGSHGNKQSILVSNCGGGQHEGVCEKSVYMCATACIYICVRFLCDIFICVWQQDVQTNLQHGWFNLPSHSSDSSEGKIHPPPNKNKILAFWTYILSLNEKLNDCEWLDITLFTVETCYIKEANKGDNREISKLITDREIRNKKEN